MKTIKAFFEKLAHVGIKRYCHCGHAVSANLPFCPFCGARIADEREFPVD